MRLAYEIRVNETAAREHRNHRFLDGPGYGFSKNDPCDDECRKALFCQSICNDIDEHLECMDRGLLDKIT